jgi:hypothetical protein
MKNNKWKFVLIVSIVTMLTGLLFSLYGIHFQDQQISYVGISIIITTCIVWWIWIMTVIRAMWNFVQNTVDRVSEIRQNVKEVKQLFQEYKNLKNR